MNIKDELHGIEGGLETEIQLLSLRSTLKKNCKLEDTWP